ANRSDLKKTAALIKKGLKLELWQTALIVAPMTVIMAWSIPMLVPVPASLRAELRVGILIYFAAIWLSPFEIYRLALECLQRGYLVNIAILAQSLIVFVCSIWLAWLGYGIAGQFIALVAGTAGFSILVWAFGNTVLPRTDNADAVEISTRE